MSNNKVNTMTLETALQIQRRRAAGSTWATIRHEFFINPKSARDALAKHGLHHSPNGGNYRRAEMWRRPCLRCGSTERRAKYLFRCKACRAEGRYDLSAQDSMYASGDGASATGPGRTLRGVE